MKENQSLEFLEGENRSYDELTAKGNEFHFSILEQKLKEQLGVSAINSDILRTLGLLGADGKYKNAGALLADENSFYGIDCARFGDSIDIILDREIFEHKSILKQYDEAVTLYRKYYQYDEIEGALRKTVELIPEKAFREAMFKDRLEVFSPGGLPKGITQEEYLNGQVSVLRNPIVASVFFRLNIIESFGTGVQRMNMAYAESRAKPRHEFSTHAIKVVLPVVSGGEELSEDEAIIYNSMNRLGKSSSQIAKSVGFGKNKTLKLLVALEEKGYVTKLGNGRGIKYLIKS